MTKITLNFFLLFCLTLIYSPKSLALSKLGHQLVCQLSYENLSANTKEKVDTLVNSLPKQQQNIIKKYNHLSKKTTVTFAHACTWPDAIKKQKQYRKFSSWHYVNVPRNAQQVLPKHCKKNCLPQAIIVHQQQLTKTTSIKEKREALLFLSHWLGDIHQPLHISFKSDLGGNKSQIDNKLGKCENLHWYWDECLLKFNNKNKKSLLKELKPLWQAPTNDAWQPASVWLWANESYKLTRSADLKYCKLNKAKQCQPYTNEKVIINKPYADKFHPILKQQIAKAAIRLTQVLESSF